MNVSILYLYRNCCCANNKSLLGPFKRIKAINNRLVVTPHYSLKSGYIVVSDTDLYLGYIFFWQQATTYASFVSA